MPRPPLLIPALSLVAGISAGWLFQYFPVSAAALVICGLALMLFRRCAKLIIIAAFFFFVFGFSSFYIHGPGGASTVSVLAGKPPATLDWRVVRPPLERDGYTTLYLSPEGKSPRLWGRAGLARVGVRGAGLDVSYGDILRGAIRLARPTGFKDPGVFDWGEYSVKCGIDAVGRARPNELVRVGRRASPLLYDIYSFRREVSAISARSLPGEAGALFRAEVLGDQSGVTDDVRDVFSAAGTTHILSVSGSHVALLAGLIYFLIKWAFLLAPGPLALRLSLKLDYRKVAAVAAIPVCVFYCLLTGSEAPTVRSVFMVVVYLVSVLVDRDGDIVNTLCAAALLTLAVDPSALFDISFQLSYISVLFIALMMRELKGAWQGPPETGFVSRIKSRLTKGALVSLAVTLGVAPLAAHYFHTFSYVAIPANLVVSPVAGWLVVPVGLVSCLIHAVSPGNALPLAGLNAAALWLFTRVNSLFASAPWANLRPPASGAAITSIFYLTVIVAAFAVRDVRRKASIAVGAFALVAVTPFIPMKSGHELRVTFLDVGQGDSALVEFPGGERMLIDGGGSTGIDPGRAVVAQCLWDRGVHRLDYVVLSHPHPDHMEGLVYIMKNFEVGQVWEGQEGPDSCDYHIFEASIPPKTARYRLKGPGELQIGGVTAQVLRCGGAPGASTEEVNNGSVVLRLKYGDVSFLFTGDAGREAQEEALREANPLPLASTVLKVPHHGSAVSLSEGFLAAVSPKYAVISVGRDNSYGHPSKAALDALARGGARVFRTDHDGAVTFTTDGNSLKAISYDEGRLKPASTLEDEINNLIRAGGSSRLKLPAGAITLAAMPMTGAIKKRPMNRAATEG